MRLRLHSTSAPLAALAVIALLAAGCGSSGSGSSSGGGSGGAGYGGGYGGSGSAATTATPSTTAAGGTAAAATVRTASTPLGTILVDAGGRTLYLWKADTGSVSTCDGACAQAWPPLTTSGRAAAGSGVASRLLGASARSDGTMQVTYAGHPLYYFAGDAAAGDTNGQDSDGFGAQWYVVAPSGKADEAGGS